MRLWIAQTAAVCTDIAQCNRGGAEILFPAGYLRPACCALLAASAEKSLVSDSEQVSLCET